MRLDKYLKVSRIIKRRTVAHDVSEMGRVYINGKTAKPSAQVEEGDIIVIEFGNRQEKYRVLKVTETTTKQGAAELYEVLQGENE